MGRRDLNERFRFGRRRLRLEAGGSVVWLREGASVSRRGEIRELYCNAVCSFFFLCCVPFRCSLASLACCGKVSTKRLVRWHRLLAACL